MSPKYVKVAIIIAIIVVIAFAVPTLAKGPGGSGIPGGGGGGGGGNKPPSELGNNLSVPTIMVKNVFTGVVSGTPAAPSALTIPTGLPSTGWPIDDGYYYVQRVSYWQAQAYTYAGLTTKTGTAAWGDNLGGDAKLKVGSPIRVELGLFDDAGDVTLLGYKVDKLEPLALDRESAYGTRAIPGPSEGTWQGDPIPFSWYDEAGVFQNAARIYDSAVTFSIQNVATGAFVVLPGSNPTGEINAGGAIVYGYNLRVSAAGAYKITFTIPNVDITGVDAGDFESIVDAPDTVWTTINVTGGGGGGGKPH